MNCLSKEDKQNYFNKINKFYKYNKKIIDSMNNKQLCNYDYTNIIKQIDNTDKNKISNLLYKISIFLDDHNIEYWLDSGTLLGAVRNNKFIPWDDDIDLAIPQKSYEILYNIMLKLKQIKIKNQIYYISEKYKLKFYWSTQFDSQSTNNPLYILNYPSMLFVQHLDFNLDYKCDLILYIKKNDKYITNLPMWLNIFYYNVKDIYPLKNIKFENQYYKCVNNPIPFLNNSYWFWKHIGVASHAHTKDLENTRNKTIYFKFPNKYIKKLSLKNIKYISNKHKKTIKHKK